MLMLAFFKFYNFKLQIANYSGKAAICVSLVTVDEPAKVHAHNLVGKDARNGLFYIEDTKKSWIQRLDLRIFSQVLNSNFYT